MSQGSCVAAREGVPPPARSPATASVVAAARASSALLICRSRGLTVIVESAFLLGWEISREPVNPDRLPCPGMLAPGLVAMGIRTGPAAQLRGGRPAW